MPASKRELSPPESESKIRKLDEDGDAMPSKVATILNTVNSPERSTAPRTKKKLSPSPGGNNSRPSSPLSDSSESVSDPPFKKAKLLSRSAFSTVSSEESESTSLTQTALTESDEASIGSSNTDFVRRRDGSDKAICIIQCSNKPKAEEPSEPNEELPCSPSDPVQTDHSYGRVSEMTETDQDGKNLQEFTSLVPESQRPTVTETIETSTGKMTEYEAEPSHCASMHVLERQKTDTIIIDSCSDFLDNGTSVASDGKEKDETSSQPQSRNTTLLDSEKAHCLVENVDPNEIERQGALTAVQVEGLIEAPTVLVTGEFDQDVEYQTEENYPETLVEETCTDFIISDPLLTKNSESVQFLAVSSSPERYRDNSASTVQNVTNLEQTDSTVQFHFDESAELEQMQEQVSNTFTNTSDCIDEITEALHKNEARQKMEMVTTSNECGSQNITSNEKATSKDQEDHDNHRANDSTPVVIGDSLMEKEKPYNEDAAMLNGQLSVEIPTGVPEGISYAAVEITSCETQAVLGSQTEGSSTSGNIKSDYCHESTEPASSMPQNVSEFQTSQNEMTAVSPALQESLCSVQTVEVQGEIQLNTSDQYFKELEVDTFELQEETVKDQTKTINHSEQSELVHQDIVLAVNMENSVVSERGTHVLSKIENEHITAESKVEVESNHDGTVTVPVSPPVPTVDVQGEIQLNTSDQYFKEPDVETFELQEEIVKHKTKTMNYFESSEIVHQEMVVAVNMENSVASEQSTHVSSTIEKETITAESKDEVGSNHDGSAVVPVSPPTVETIFPPEVTSAVSPKICPQYQEVSETSELTEVDHVEYTAVTEHYIKGPVESPISHTNTQTNVLPNIISASATEEMNPPSMEMCLDVSEASSEIQTVKAHNLQNISSGEMVDSEHQSSISSEEMPISSTVEAYESTNTSTSQAEDVQESFISNAFTEHSEDAVAEYYTTTDVQTIETSVEISVRTCTVELDPNNDQDVTTPDSEIGDVNNVDIEELSTDCADTIGMEVRLSEEKLAVQEVMTENVDEQTITVSEESEVAPSIVLAEETRYSVPFFSEVHSENIEGEEMQTESIVVDTNVVEDNTVISESQKIEGENKFETNESAVDANDLSIETQQVLLNTEKHIQESQGNEETMIVAYQQEDVHSVEEPNKNTESDVKKHENQIVYEPISSPESITDGEVPTLPDNHDPVGLVHTDITNTSQILYSVSALSTDKEMLVSDGYGTAEIPSVPLESSAVISPIEEYKVINGKLFQNDKSIRSEYVLDNQTALQHLQSDGLSSVLQNEDNEINNQRQKNEEYSDKQVMSEAHTAAKLQSTTESMVFEQLEQCCAEDVTVSVTSASEDAPDGQLENTEEKSEESVVTASVFSEQVLEVTGPEAVAGTENATVTFTTQNQEADSTCEEYVILEPVPVTAIHYDIITQAVAESGLSEEINANTESIIAEVQQTSVVKDDVNEKITEETIVQEISPQSTDVMEETPANCELDVTQPVDVNMEPPECQILEDIEIGREIVVAEEEQEEDSDISIIEKPQESTTEEAKNIDENVNETSKDIGNETSKETISLDTVKKDCTTPESKEPEKPKKQEMNTQARTKARLAALAEQKAAASKRQARREQLNLLALCQEIAEDIATDSMLLKKIEEEKQAAALAAAKDEAKKNESPPAQSLEEPLGDLVAPTPERTEVSSPSVTPAEDNTVTQPSTANADESKAAAEPPKRRFFTSQVSVPLKAHEKKKLTRYQRLRQVELQREKMSWARVKKLKSDQANQMFSEMDWQASMSFSSLAMDHVATASQPVPSLIKPPSPGLSSTNQPAPNVEEPEVEVSKPEAIVSEPAKVLQTETAKATTEEKPETDKTELTQKEDSKAEPSKPELRKSSRISKIESSKSASTPPPATKGKATSKKVLPAVPPPMPNGLNNQNLKIEYKPYKPRPKYSPDDFELDDDPIPPPRACPQAKPTHQMRSNVQGRPASQTITFSKPTVSTQHSNQLKSNVLKPVGQISGQTKPASSALPHSPAAQALLKGTQATPSSSKILPTTKVLQKTTVSTSPQSKVVVAPTESKPAASLLQGKPASTTSQKETASSVDQPAPSEMTPAVPPDDTAGSAKCKATEDVPTAPVLTKEGFHVSNDTQKSDQNKATLVHPEDETAAGVQPKSKTESEETDLNKASQLGQDQNVETPISDTSLQKEIKKLKEADKDGTQTIIDAGQKHFGPVACSVCGMLYSAANPEDESQHLLFHNQFISAVKYVGWKKERILSEFPDGKIILVLPDDPKYALKKIEEIREMVDNDLGFQQVESKCPSKTFLFISNDKKVAGCLIAEHINEGYRVIEELALSGSEGEKVMFERQRAWCCSTTAEPAICGISRIWVVNTMRRQGIASRMLDCLRNNFIYGSNLSKDEIAFSDPTPDGKLFATHYFGTSQFLVYNFVNGTPTTQAKPEKV